MTQAAQELPQVETQTAYPSDRGWKISFLIPNKARFFIAARILLIIFAFSTFSIAQWSKNPVYRFDHLTHEQGLSQSTVNAIVQDGIGFIWFGTQDGLNRFDGYNIVTYKHSQTDSTSLSDDGIWALAQDRAGDIWIGTMRGGLNKYLAHEDRFVNLAHIPSDPTSISDNNVTSIFQDSRGILWVGTLNGGLNRLDIDSKRFLRYLNDPSQSGSLSNNTVWGICEDRSGNIWLATGHGLCKIPHDQIGPVEKQIQFTNYYHDESDASSLSHNYVRSVFVDREGVLWAGTWGGGLEKFNSQTGGFIHHRAIPGNPNSISSNLIFSITEDTKGLFWIGTGDAGVNLLDRKNGDVTLLRRSPDDPRSLANDIITTIYEDRSGIVWLGTGAGGVSRYDRRRQRFALFRDDPRVANDLHGNDVWAILEDSQEYLWIGTYNHGLNRIDPQTLVVSSFIHNPSNPLSLSHNVVLSIAESRTGDIWIATEEGGLDRYERATNRFIHYRHDPKNPNSLPVNSLTRVLEDRSGIVWIGTNGAGLVRHDPRTGVFTSFHPDPSNPHSLSGLTVMSLFEDSRGDLWIGTWGDGVNRLDKKSERFTRYTTDARSISNNTVLSFFEDETGNLWMGTYGGGLNLFDRSTGSFTHFTDADGLPNNVVYGILPDAHGSLWLSTNKGIARFNPKTGTVATFDVRDGLQGNEFNQGAYFRNRRGELFFGGINGLNVFHPDSIRDNPYIPPVVLTKFKVFDKPLAIAGALSSIKSIELTHAQNYFSFEFIALNFTSSEKNRYAYKLDGLDHDWVYANERRYASYTNLDPGTYILRVKAANNDGLWNEDGLAVSVTILAPYWKTWWFRVFAVVAFGAALFGLYRYRVHKLLEIERLRASIATDLHDDIGSTLTEIALFSDVAIRELNASNSGDNRSAEDTSRITNRLEDIGSTARNLIDAMNDIVWSIDPKNDSFEFLLLRMKTHAARMFQAKGINYEIDIPEELSGLRLPLGFRRRFFLIYKEAINNVIRHAQASRVTLTMHRENKSLVMTISDDGNGFDPAQTNAGNGLRNMRERAAGLPGALTVASARNAGTTVRLAAHIP